MSKEDQEDIVAGDPVEVAVAHNEEVIDELFKRMRAILHEALTPETDLYPTDADIRRVLISAQKYGVALGIILPQLPSNEEPLLN